MKPVLFDTRRFALCGHQRDDRGAERIRGTVLSLLPSGPTAVRTVRIRARIDGFNRDRYQVGPHRTDAWFVRVQQLAPVVAADGTIEVNVFAAAPAMP